MRALKPVLLPPLFAVVFALMALAPVAKAQDAQRLEAAKAYVETPSVQEMLDNMLSPQMLSTIIAGMIPAGKATEEQLAKVSSITSDELDGVRPDMERIMIEAAASHFTLAEINALTAFYSSADGASISRKMLPYMTQAMQQMGPLVQEMQARLVRRIKSELGNQ